MPKNLIEVIDNTTSGLVYSRIRTIYIPGPSTNVTGQQVLCTNTNKKDSAGEDSLYYDKENIRGWDKTSLSFKLAEYLIDNYGFQVVYEGIGQATQVPEESWKNLKYSEYDIDYITTGQFGYVDKTAINVAYYRKDCTYLADHTVNPLEQSILRFTQQYLNKEEPEDWDSDTYYVKVAKFNYLKKVDGEVKPFIPNTYYKYIADQQYELLKKQPGDWESAYTGDTSDSYGSLDSSGDNGYLQLSGQNWEDNIYYEKVSANTYDRLFTEPDNFDSEDYYVAYIPYSTNHNYVYRVYYKLEEVSSDLDTTSYALAVRSQFNSVIGQDSTNAAYASGFTPWFYSNIKGLETTQVPASFGYIFAYGTSIKSNPLWFASAGPERGLIPELVSPVINYSRLDVEILQARAETQAVDLDNPGDNIGIAINPIANIRPFGTILYGNRTLRYNPAGADLTGEVKASSFLNIRNLVSLIARTAKSAAERYKFDQNNSFLWTKFSNALTPVLEEAVAGGGILGYRLIQQQAEKKARLKAKLVIVPIEAVEDMKLTIELADSIEVSTNE